MTEERRTEIYKKAYIAGHNRALENLKDTTKRRKRNQGRKVKSEYTEEEYKVWTKGYAAGYTYTMKYKEEEIDI